MSRFVPSIPLLPEATGTGATGMGVGQCLAVAMHPVLLSHTPSNLGAWHCLVLYAPCLASHTPLEV